MNRIRYAAAPVGTLRWQEPQAPTTNRSMIIANTFGSPCPQSFPQFPGAPFWPGNEDCLFLNVYAPSNGTNLPVVVTIHGGGYGQGDASQDMSAFINTNENKLIAVTIQYRVYLPLERAKALPLSWSFVDWLSRSSLALSDFYLQLRSRLVQCWMLVSLTRILHYSGCNDTLLYLEVTLITLLSPENQQGEALLCCML